MAPVFKVTRHPAELVVPTNTTPHEVKLLSDIDDQNGIRILVPMVYIYRYHPSMEGKDPVEVIRQALSKSLVFYYPFAGRHRDAPNGKLMVDCNEKGVTFIEADANVTLHQFGNDLFPPYPYHELLPNNVPGLDGIIDSPLLLIQVTRLKCGSFILALRFNHTMCDVSGIFQFLKALAEIACGAPKPSILPVWCRELLCARNPPKITCTHREYDRLPPHGTKSNFELCQRSFFFGPKEIAAIRGILPYHLAQSSSSFEVLTSFLWRCRTKALYWQDQYQDQEVRLMSVVNARYGHCSFKPPLPEGFYGNAFVLPAAVTTVGKLCGQTLGYALELVKKARYEATEEYVHSVADLMATNGRPCFTRLWSFVVSDVSKIPLMDVDFGWGKALYGGLSLVPSEYPEASNFMSFTNSKGEKGRVIIMCLPLDVMETFKKELDYILKTKNNDKSNL